MVHDCLLPFASLARCSLAICQALRLLALPLSRRSLAFIVVETLTLDFCNYQPKWACRFCFHFVGLTTAFFAFYTPIWVGISLASIAVEAVATFQILGKKINPVTKMSRFTRPFGLGVLAGGVARTVCSN